MPNSWTLEEAEEVGSVLSVSLFKYHVRGRTLIHRLGWMLKNGSVHDRRGHNAWKSLVEVVECNSEERDDLVLLRPSWLQQSKFAESASVHHAVWLTIGASSYVRGSTSTPRLRLVKRTARATGSFAMCVWELCGYRSSSRMERLR